MYLKSVNNVDIMPGDAYKALLILALLIGCVIQAEPIEKPLAVQAPETSLEANTLEPHAAQTLITGAISLDDPRPKLHPELSKKATGKKKVRVLIDAENKEALRDITERVQEQGGNVHETYDVGGVAVAEVPAETLEDLALEEHIKEITEEKEYHIFVQDRISNFSINTIWTHNLTGENINIAILDTGVGPHDDITIAAGASFVNEGTADENGHGTHVAGIAQAVAPGAHIYNAKVLNQYGSGTTSQILAGINWAVDPDGNPSTQDGADIISMSFGGMFTELDGPLASAVQDAINQGVIFIVASGNCRQGCGGFYGVTTPGNVEEVISVGAVDNNNVMAAFSSGENFGGYIKPDIVGPGVDITSAWLNNGQNTQSGTSMSTPFIAGVTALLLEQQPGLSHEDVKQAITSTALDSGSTGWDTEYGAGLVDVLSLLGQNDAENTTNTSDSETNQTMPTNQSSPANESAQDAEDDTIIERIGTDSEHSPYEGTWDEISIDKAAAQSNISLPTLRIKIRANATRATREQVDAILANATQEQTILSQAIGNGEIIYLDSYDYDSSIWDGIVWDGDYMDAELVNFESGTQTICWDWCDDGNYDHCFFDGPIEMFNCMLASSVVSDVCNTDPNDCVLGDMDDYHVIDTAGVAPYSCNVQTYYVRNCDGSPAAYTSSTERWHITEERKYDCDGHHGASTYDDEIYHGTYGTGWRDVNSDISCGGSAYGCDENKDDGAALFTSDGLSRPEPPCSLQNEYGGCASDSDCLSGHCSQVWGTDYCCPVGEEWDGTQCTAPCPDNDGDGYGNPGQSNCPQGSQTDCNDQDNQIFPGATERCNGVDDNCDAQIDEGCPCTLTGTQWIPSGTVQEGTLMTMRATGHASCTGDTATFEIREDEPIGSDHIETISPIQFANGKFETTWPSVWLDDGFGQGDPEFFFSVQPTTGNSMQSNNLIVTQTPCSDNDGDGYGNPGTSTCPAGSQTDCNDNNNQIYPGAAETCNGQDDNCNGQSDEGSVCCTITNAYWNPSGPVYGNQNVQLIAQGTSSCSGKNADFEIYEDDVAADDYMTTLNDNSFSSGQFKVTWAAQYVSDPGGPEFYFNVIPSQGNGAQSPLLDVLPPLLPLGESCTTHSQCQSGLCYQNECTEPCQDSDGDGYGTSTTPHCAYSGIDCDDNNPNVNPGATEQCNSVDDNCNGQTNENNVCCGNSQCDNGENPTTCSQDCYGQLRIVDIISAPTQVDQAEQVQITAKLQNQGTWIDTLKVEAAVVPDYWAGTIFSQQYGAQAYYSVAKCCPGNNYYDAKQITLGPGQSENVIFTVTAPTIHSTDTCSGNPAFESAWDQSHTVFVGIYDQCGGGYVHKDTANIKVNEISCTQDSDCQPNEYCNFSGYYGVCAPLTCTDECSNHDQYYCDGPNIKHCVDNNNDGCYEIEFIDYCSGTTTCVGGQSSCQTQTANAALQLEEAQGHVYTQPGDRIKAHIDHQSTGQITLEYDHNKFLLDTASCPGDTFTLTQDETCEFIAQELGSTSIGIQGGNSQQIEIIDNPDTLLITNKEKLEERFGSNIQPLLEQAYTTASTKRGIVYDLNEYINGHPWGSFSSYQETAETPFITNNIYTGQIAGFIQDRCNGCEDIIIVGDDFVVPQYRIEYTNIYNWWPWWQTGLVTDFLYSDQPYIPLATRKLADIDTVIEEQNTLLVVRPGMYATLPAMTNLEQTLTQDYNVQVQYIDSGTVDCDSRIQLSGGNLLLIGNRQNNNAIQCTPWFGDVPHAGDTFESSITLERNVWGGDGSYAIIVSGNEVNRGLTELNRILQAPNFYEQTILANTNKAYVHEFSTPPEVLTLGETVKGFVLGQCEQVSSAQDQAGCVVADMTLSLAPVTGVLTDARDAVIYCIVKRLSGGTPGVLDNIVCVSSATGTTTSIFMLSGVGTLPSIPGDIFSGVVKRIAKGVKAVFGTGIVSNNVMKILRDHLSIWDFEKAAIFFKSNTQSGMLAKANHIKNQADYFLSQILSKYKREWNKIFNYFDEAVLHANLADINNFEELAIGTNKALAKTPSGQIADIAPTIAAQTKKMEFLQNLGNLEKHHSASEYVDDIMELQDSLGVDRVTHTLTHDLTTSGTLKEGRKWEVRGARKLKDGGVTPTELQLDITTTDIDVLSNTGDIYELKAASWNVPHQDPSFGTVVANLRTKLQAQVPNLRSWQLQHSPGSKIYIYIDGSNNPQLRDALLNSPGLTGVVEDIIFGGTT